jgi:hypothetical protein
VPAGAGEVGAVRAAVGTSLLRVLRRGCLNWYAVHMLSGK